MLEGKNHIVQSEKWGEIKTKLGTSTVSAGGVQYTKHKIPFTNKYYGYCPKVNPFLINFDELKKSARDHDVITINFDCPNVVVESDQEDAAVKILSNQCTRSPRNTFAKSNVLLDISKTEEELLKNMHPKCRYNINYAQKNGITIAADDEIAFDVFFDLFEKTSERQKFYIHSKHYYQTIYTELVQAGMAKILLAKCEGNAVSAWMFLMYEGVLYYIYGGWSGERQNLFPNNLLCWEGIKLGKLAGCETFDMWGAAIDVNDSQDPYYGFTQFKLKFGGKHVTYIDSFDLIIDPALYHSFNTANSIRWFLLKLIKN